MPLGRAHQIVDRRFGGAHLFKHLFRGDAPVHDPSAVGLAVLGFDFFDEVRQGGLVGGVARHHFVGQREAVRRDDERNHHLDAIGALVATVAELPLAGLRHVALKIGAGQIVQQHVKSDAEQCLPAFAQKAEQPLLVRHQLVQAAVQLVALHQPVVFAQQIRHGAPLKPFSVQPPLAAGVDQPVAHQRLEHVQPARALARRRQLVGPEVVQPQLAPQLAGEPAGPPLPRLAQFQGVEPDVHGLATQRRRLPVGGEQGKLCRATPAIGEHLDGLAPHRPLAVVNLAQIQHVPLHHTARGGAPVFHNAPVAVLFAVLETGLCA